MFFSKANLVTATKKYFQGVFSTFESQDNMQIEYIWVNMLMFLKNPIKGSWSRQKWAIFFKACKIMVFEILTFVFYLDEKRQP